MLSLIAFTAESHSTLSQMPEIAALETILNTGTGRLIAAAFFLMCLGALLGIMGFNNAQRRSSEYNKRFLDTNTQYNSKLLELANKNNDINARITQLFEQFTVLHNQSQMDMRAEQVNTRASIDRTADVLDRVGGHLASINRREAKLIQHLADTEVAIQESVSQFLRHVNEIVTHVEQTYDRSHLMLTAQERNINSLIAGMNDNLAVLQESINSIRIIILEERSSHVRTTINATIGEHHPDRGSADPGGDAAGGPARSEQDHSDAVPGSGGELPSGDAEQLP